MPEFSLRQIARKLGLEMKGEDITICGLNTLEEAGPDELSFLANPKYAHYLPDTRAGAVILHPGHADKARRVLISENPYQDFGRALALFARPEGRFHGLSPLASIHPEAKLGENCTVYPFVFIGPGAELGKDCVLYPGVYIGEDCRLGDGCVLYPNVVLMSAVRLGQGCVLNPGVVLGADGFGFTRAGGGIQKIPQAGYVRLGDRVEIGANSAVDRGALGPTCIGDDSKLDNLVQIGHNVRVGKGGLLVAQVGVAGSARLGDNVTLAGQAGIAGHLSIGDNAVIGPQAGVAHDVPENFQGSGHPFMDSQTYLRSQVIIPKLPSLYKSVKKLEKDMEDLKTARRAGQE
ncbi:MAG: UDP-3-O-(3-hydroxymyristoyl)glucosamine N-acyltransferase [Deltaproteobacteria bacterium]|jgi:UDP-3-O-[3-hydroxymyristoyl] glucosamine N-acyltransferase|nr:UDP-3-O-(3-hydroxymyristoyl)glucosamine N-acyltransferase [Deltaproteobacteria bacterium]